MTRHSLGYYLSPSYLCLLSIFAPERGQKLKLSPDTLNYVKHHIQTSLDTEEVGMELDDDHFWKMGFFYYNPADPSSIIENRFGVGIGFNFARGWVKIATVIGLSVLSFFMSC